MFTCLYLHKPKEIGDPFLAAFATALLRAIDHIRDLVRTGEGMAMWSPTVLASLSHSFIGHAHQCL